MKLRLEPILVGVQLENISAGWKEVGESEVGEEAERKFGFSLDHTNKDGKKRTWSKRPTHIYNQAYLA